MRELKLRVLRGWMTAVRHRLGALTLAYTSDVDPMEVPI